MSSPISQLQEFLCAEYLVRDSFPERLSEYLQHYSAPVAVAVAISSNPTNWLGSLFLRSNIMANFTAPSLREFIARLLLERPVFECTPVLGFVVAKIFRAFERDEVVRNLLQAFTEIDEVHA